MLNLHLYAFLIGLAAFATAQPVGYSRDALSARSSEHTASGKLGVETRRSSTQDPDSVDFTQVGDEYRRSARSQDEPKIGQRGDEYQRKALKQDEVDFNEIGDEY